MKSKRCFLIQPFDNGQFDKRCKDVFIPAINNAGLEPYRVDQDISATVLIETIEREIKSAAVCLADISTDNPNVWYELGFALALAKPVVIVCEKQRKKFPFDIQHRAIIQYAAESSSDFENLKQKITDKIQAFLNSSSKTDSKKNTEEKINSFDVNWYDIETKQIIGKELSIDHTFDIFPKHIPDYKEEPVSRHSFAYDIIDLNKINKNYYRELVDFLFKKFSFFPVAFSVKNIGNSIAKDVRIEIRVKNEDIYCVYEHTDIPDDDDIPKKTLSIYDTINKNIYRNLKKEGDLTVTEESDIFTIEIEYNQIQIGRSINSAPFYIAKKSSGYVTFQGTIFSQLPPVDFEIVLNCNIESREVTMDKFLEAVEKID
jgi:nucleoside 2-deoxyribosyltransferase